MCGYWSVVFVYGFALCWYWFVCAGTGLLELVLIYQLFAFVFS